MRGSLGEFNGLGGTVPFDMTAQRLTVTDNEGTWLTLRDVGLDIDPAGLLSRKLHIRLLRVRRLGSGAAPFRSSHPRLPNFFKRRTCRLTSRSTDW